MLIGEARQGAAGAPQRSADPALAGRVAFALCSVVSSMQCSVTQAALMVRLHGSSVRLLGLSGGSCCPCKHDPAHR